MNANIAEKYAFLCQPPGPVDHNKPAKARLDTETKETHFHSAPRPGIDTVTEAKLMSQHAC